MPISIKNLVNQSPVRWSDGTMFLGKKSSQFFAIDLKDGKCKLSFSDADKLPSEDSLREVLENPEQFIFIARTEYHLTAYRLDGPPKKLSFSEFSGIKDPTIMWRRTEEGHVIEFEPSLLDPMHLSKAESGFALFSSFNGILYGRNRKDGSLLWAHQFASPTVSVFKMCSAGENSLVPYDQIGTQGIDVVNLPIEMIESEEIPDKNGEISHPLDVTSVKKQQSRAEDSPFADLVNIGEYDGVLYVLPHSRFPRFRAPAKAYRASSRQDSTASKETALMRKPDYYANLWGQSCFPTDEDWPYCLMNGPQFVYEQAPIQMLEAGPSSQDAGTPVKMIWTGLIGIFAALFGFFGSRIWRTLRRKPLPRPPPPKPKPVDLSQSSQRSRPPGFEEITLTSADYFYEVQGYNIDAEDSAPRSFIVTDQVLGYGSHGTVVFRGTFDGRDVAVKRMLIDFYDVAGHEVSLLQQSDNHPNVIRYFCREQTDRFMYIVLELCPASLADVVEQTDLSEAAELFGPDNPMDKRRILKEIMLGLEHLHATKLVHRDMKPANILISPNRRVLLSDFGLSKKLADDQSSFHATVQSGTIGWRAPECILNDEVAKLKSRPAIEGMPKGIKITKAIDIFAAGCIFYYVLTDGSHPFGSRMQREMNIVQNQVSLSELDSDPVAQDLVRRMISRDATKRPTASQILAHPYFWEPSKRLAFLLDVSDHIERENRHVHPTNKALEACRPRIYNGQSAWSSIVDPIFWEDLSKFRKYFGNSVQDLLRAMRNKRHHFQELDPELKKLLGESAEAYVGYFEGHFPHLLLQVYLVLETSPFRAVHPFKDVYFADDLP